MRKKIRKWLILEDNYNLDDKYHITIIENDSDEGLNIQIPIADMLGLDSLVFKMQDDKKGRKKYIQNARLISKAPEMFDLLSKIIKSEVISDEDILAFDDIKNYISSKKEIGKFDSESKQVYVRSED